MKRKFGTDRNGGRWLKTKWWHSKHLLVVSVASVPVVATAVTIPAVVVSRHSLAPQAISGQWSYNGQQYLTRNAALVTAIANEQAAIVAVPASWTFQNQSYNSLADAQAAAMVWLHAQNEVTNGQEGNPHLILPTTTHPAYLTNGRIYASTALMPQITLPAVNGSLDVYLGDKVVDRMVLTDVTFSSADEAQQAINSADYLQWVKGDVQGHAGNEQEHIIETRIMKYNLYYQHGAIRYLLKTKSCNFQWIDFPVEGKEPLPPSLPSDAISVMHFQAFTPATKVQGSEVTVVQGYDAIQLAGAQGVARSGVQTISDGLVWQGRWFATSADLMQAYERDSVLGPKIATTAPSFRYGEMPFTHKSEALLAAKKQAIKLVDASFKPLNSRT